MARKRAASSADTNGSTPNCAVASVRDPRTDFRSSNVLWSPIVSPTRILIGEELCRDVQHSPSLQSRALLLRPAPSGSLLRSRFAHSQMPAVPPETVQLIERFLGVVCF